MTSTTIALKDPALLQEILKNLRVVSGPNDSGEHVAWCVFHPDGEGTPPHQPNLHVSERGYYCHACEAGGSLQQLVAHLGLQDSHKEPDIQSTYDYVDEDGKLLFQVVRKPGKRFLQRRPDPSSGWIWKLSDVRRVLYRLPDLLGDRETDVYLVEGEKDADRLASEGLVATTNAGGAGKWRDEYSEGLRDRDVVILPDNDSPGQNHAQRVAKALSGVASSVKVVELPGLEDKGDVSDWLGQGNTTQDLVQLVESATVWEGDGSPSKSDGNSSSDTDKKESQATAILQLLDEEEVELFHDQRSEPYSRILLPEGKQIIPTNSRRFEQWLSQLIYTKTGKVSGTEAIRAAKSVIDGKACFEGSQHELQVRIAQGDGAIWVDLDGRRAVKVTAGAWSIAEEPPILFRSSSYQVPFPTPERGGKPEQLFELLNIKDPDTRLLLLGFLVAALVPDIAIAALIVHGVQGAAKTTLLKMVKKILDPSRVEVRSAVRQEGEFAQLAWQNRCIFFDNLSSIPVWLSDSLCRAISGEAWDKRKLYSDEDSVIFEYRRVIGLAGISQVANKPDLLDRSIIIELEPILDEQRIPEQKLWKAFDEIYPGILGGLLDLLAGAMAIEPTLKLERLPRMADFAKWGEAAAVAQGHQAGQFLEAYRRNVGKQSDAAVDSSPVAQAVLDFMAVYPTWKGTPGELLSELSDFADHLQINTRSRSWPSNPSTLSRWLKEVEPPLRGKGIEVTTGVRTGARRLITLRNLLHVDNQAPESDQVSSSDGNVTAPEITVTNAVTTQQFDIIDINDPCDGNDGNDGVFVSCSGGQLPTDQATWPEEWLQKLEETREWLQTEKGHAEELAEEGAVALTRTQYRKANGGKDVAQDTLSGETTLDNTS